MVQVVTEAGHKEPKHLEVVHEPVHLPGLEHGEHGLTHIESMSPVMIFDGPVVLLHAKGPSTYNLIKSIMMNSQTKNTMWTNLVWN